MALGGGTIADVTTIQQRAVAMSLYSLGPMAGPVRPTLYLILIPLKKTYYNTGTHHLLSQ